MRSLTRRYARGADCLLGSGAIPTLSGWPSRVCAWAATSMSAATHIEHGMSLAHHDRRRHGHRQRRDDPLSRQQHEAPNRVYASRPRGHRAAGLYRREVDHPARCHGGGRRNHRRWEHRLSRRPARGCGCWESGWDRADHCGIHGRHGARLDVGPRWDEPIRANDVNPALAQEMRAALEDHRIGYIR